MTATIDGTRRYAIDIIRADGTCWRTVHLWAASSDDALRRTRGWIARNIHHDGYAADNARPA